MSQINTFSRKLNRIPYLNSQSIKYLLIIIILSINPNIRKS